MLKRVDELLAQARLCAQEPGKVGSAGATIMSFLVLHLKQTVVEIPSELEGRVKLIERFCKE